MEHWARHEGDDRGGGGRRRDGGGGGPCIVAQNGVRKGPQEPGWRCVQFARDERCRYTSLSAPFAFGTTTGAALSGRAARIFRRTLDALSWMNLSRRMRKATSTTDCTWCGKSPDSCVERPHVCRHRVSGAYQSVFDTRRRMSTAYAAGVPSTSFGTAGAKNRLAQRLSTANVSEASVQANSRITYCARCHVHEWFSRERRVRSETTRTRTDAREHLIEHAQAQIRACRNGLRSTDRNASLRSTWEGKGRRAHLRIFARSSPARIGQRRPS